MANTFYTVDASPLGALVRSSVDANWFGSAGGILVAGASQQSHRARTGGAFDWALSAVFEVWGTVGTRPTDLRGTLTPPTGTYSWAGVALVSDTPSATTWQEIFAGEVKTVVRQKGGSTTADVWTFSAGVQFNPDPAPLPDWPTTAPNFVYEAAIRSVSATPSDNTFTVINAGDSVATVGTVDVPTTAAQLVSDLNASTDPGMTVITWSKPDDPLFIDPGDGLLRGTVDAAGFLKTITLTKSGAGTGTVETSPTSNRWYNVTQTVLWSA